MAAEALLESIQPKSPRGALSGKQVETVLSRSVAGFGVLFVIQTVPSAVLQHAHLHEQYQWTRLVALLFIVTLALALVAAILQRWVKLTGTAFAVFYCLAVLTWPLAARSPLEPSDGVPWLYYLLTVATAMAAIAFPVRLAAVYLFVMPALFAFSTLVTSAGTTSRVDAVLSAIYSILLGGVILIFIAMLRQAAATVDAAQAAALESYSEAVRQHATEVERVQVDAIVHDSVLTTLLSAARASTPEARALSARMAGNAISFLHHAAAVGPDDGSAVSSTILARRIVASAEVVGVRFEMRSLPFAARMIPAPVADAVYSAAVQAMVNSAQHAGRGDEVSRWLLIRPLAPVGLEVQVGDTGAGFDESEVPIERIGLRVSIVERVAQVGGTAEIDSQPGEGTVVSIRWPDSDGVL